MPLSSKFPVKSTEFPPGKVNGIVVPSQCVLSFPPPLLTNKVEPSGMTAGDVTGVTVPSGPTSMPVPVKDFVISEPVLFVVPVSIVPSFWLFSPSSISTDVPSDVWKLPEPL